MKLGTRQLELLRALAITRALVIHNKISRRLCEIGLMKAMGEDGNSFICVTPAGLRAIADAADAGRIELFRMPERPAKTPVDEQRGKRG